MNFAATLLRRLLVPRVPALFPGAQAASRDSTARSAPAVQRVALCLIYCNYFNICSEDRNLFISSEAFLWHSLL